MWLKLETSTPGGYKTMLLNTDNVAAILPELRLIVLDAELPDGKQYIQLPQDQLEIMLHWMGIDD